MPMLASFGNGIALKFIKGEVLRAEQVLQPEFERIIARNLAQLHSIPVPHDMPTR